MSDAIEALLNSATDALRQRRLDQCITDCEQALSLLSSTDRRVPEALSLMGTAKVQMGNRAGIAEIQKAVSLDPQEPQFHMALGQALLGIGELDAAEAPLMQAWRLSRNHPAAATLLGKCLIASNKAFEAVQILGPLVEAGQASPSQIRLFAEARFNSGDIYGAKDVFSELYGAEGPLTQTDQLQFARISMALRDYQEAGELITKVLADNPASIDARVSALRLADWQDQTQVLDEHCAALAQSGRARPDAMSLVVEHAPDLNHDLISSVEALLADNAARLEEQANLGLAYALRLDREKRYDEAWQVAQTANACLAKHFGRLQTPERRAEKLATDRKHLQNAIALLKETAAAPAMPSGQQFIYLLGAPRSGSSLIQSVVAAPDGVTSIGERTSLYPYLAKAAEMGMSADGFSSYRDQLAQADLAGLARQKVAGKQLVDKTPHHLYVAGLLDRIHPGAQFVQVLRNAGDVALSMLLRPFSAAFEEATSLDALADMLEFRLEARTAWIDAGLHIPAFSYDAFVADPHDQGQRLFGLVGLDWKADYLDPSARPEPVQTFSSRQVRKPIRPASIPHWKAYQAFAPNAFARLEDISAAQNAITDTNL
ncbi:MAG: hypothetical protein CMK07_03345 [Ponticaulis sp.]|nr:hypothetical protein [Ponticaulis sp.]